MRDMVNVSIFKSGKLMNERKDTKREERQNTFRGDDYLL